MAKVNLKHSGAVIDQQIDRVIDGSVVADNTLSALDLESKKPVDSQGIAEAIEAASNSLKARGYIYMGVATPTTKPNTTAGKVFYLAAQAGEYNNFGITLPTDALTSLEWNGERWFAVRIADLVTAEEVEQAILDNTAKKIEKGEAKPVASEVIAEALEAIDKQLENKADSTKYYPEMAVGVADNLSGRGEATEEIFTYRPSAGASDSIANEGVATIKRIKGNTIVWNQLGADLWDFIYGTGTSENNNYIISSISGEFPGITCDKGSVTPLNHKILVTFRGRIEGNTNPVFYIKYQGENVGVIPYTQPSSGLASLSAIFTCTSNTNSKCSIFTLLDVTNIQIVDPQIFDLTQMFGAGNEPTTVEEFKALFTNDYYDHNAGELVSMTSNRLFTNGFNQWDEEWEVGYIDNTGNNTMSITGSIRSSYIPVIVGESYYCCTGFRTSDRFGMFLYGYDDKKAPIHSFSFVGNTVITIPNGVSYIRFGINPEAGYGQTYKGDININLSHSGVRDGEYEPYEEHIQDLSEITRYFPDGMKSVGGVFDEINLHEAVQRVGQRAYAEGDNDNPAVMTDGVKTIYPLDTPIVIPMPARAINLNYPVWDWGTERAVSDVPSAPFRADIIYGFNAVDTIRVNKLDIEALMLRVAELEAKIAETSTTTMEEENL